MNHSWSCLSSSYWRNSDNRLDINNAILTGQFVFAFLRTDWLSSQFICSTEKIVYLVECYIRHWHDVVGSISAGVMSLPCGWGLPACHQLNLSAAFARRPSLAAVLLFSSSSADQHHSLRHLAHWLNAAAEPLTGLLLLLLLTSPSPMTTRVRTLASASRACSDNLTYVEKPSCFTAELFCHPDSNFSDGRSASSQKYISGWVSALEQKIHLDVSPNHSLIFTGGGQKVRNFASVFEPVAFEAIWFRNGANIRNLRHTSERRWLSYILTQTFSRPSPNFYSRGN